MQSKLAGLLIVILCAFASVPATAQKTKVKLNKIAILTGKKVDFGTICVKDSNIYVITTVPTNGNEGFYEGAVAKVGFNGKIYWYKKIDSDTLTLMPRRLYLDGEDNVVVLSEEDLDHSTYARKGQMLNLRKFNQDGKEIYNLTDKKGLQNTSSSIFPIELGNNGKPIAIFNPRPGFMNSKNLINYYDSTGSFQQSIVIDTTIVKYDSNSKFIYQYFDISGFKQANNGLFYCWGERQFLYEAGDMADTSSAYVMAIGTDNKIKWKIKLYSETNYDHGIWTDCCVPLSDGSVVFENFDLCKKWLMKVSPEGEILWKKPYGDTSPCRKLLKIIETSSGDFIGVGYTGAQPNQDRYMVKFDKNWDMLWEVVLEKSTCEAFTDIIEYQPGKYVINESGGNNVGSYEFNELRLYSFSESDVSAPPEPQSKKNSISPNPVGDLLSIVINNVPESSTVAIFSIDGSRVLEVPYAPQIDVSLLRPGLYAALINSESYFFIKK